MNKSEREEDKDDEDPMSFFGQRSISKMMIDTAAIVMPIVFERAAIFVEISRSLSGISSLWRTK